MSTVTITTDVDVMCTTEAEVEIESEDVIEQWLTDLERNSNRFSARDMEDLKDIHDRVAKLLSKGRGDLPPPERRLDGITFPHGRTEV